MPSFRLTACLLSGWCSLATISCRQNDPELALVSYAQTGCADKWGAAPTPAQLETVATAYLAQQGIVLVNAQASRVSAPAACLACTCRTGVVLTGRVAPEQLAAIQALGFTKP